MKSYSEKEALRLKYILTLSLALLMWLFPGGVLTSLLYSISFFREDRAGVFISTFTSHIVLFLTLLLIYKKVFNTNLPEVLGKEEKRTKKFIRDGLITLIFFILFSILSPEDIIYNSEDNTLVKFFFALSAFPLLLGQTITEEIVFRVLPERILSPSEEKLTLFKRILLALFCGLFFALIHLKNIEVTSSVNSIVPIVVYFVYGTLSSFISTSLTSYIPAWAVHFANNLYAVTLVGTKGSTLYGAPIFYSSTNDISPMLILTITVIFSLVFLLESYITKRGRE